MKNKFFISLLCLFSLASCNTNLNSSSNISSRSSNSTSSSIPLESISSSSSSSSTSSSSTKENHNLVIYAVNDTHGRIEEDSSSNIMRLAKIREYIYNYDKDYNPDYSIFVSAGDMFQGTGVSNLTQGQAMSEIMNSFPFDAMAIGNHEFDWGLKTVLEKNKDIANYKFLSCNIFDRETNDLVSGLVPSTIVQKGGYKVGIVGSIMAGIDSSISYNQVKDFDIKDDIPLVENEAKKLKEQGADFVIFLTHQGNTSAVKRIVSTGLIDSVILGHTHALIDSVDQIDGKNIPILEASNSGKAYSKIILNVDGYVSHEIKTFGKREIKETKLSEETQSIITKYKDSVQTILDEKIVQIDGPFDRYGNSSNSGNLGMLITKTMYDFAVSKGLTNVIAVHNKGGVRADLIKSSYPDYVTYEDIYSVSPFDNTVRYVTLPGDRVSSAITNHFFYPSSENLNIDNNKEYNIVTIDFLTTTPGYPLYEEDGGKYIDGETLYIRDLLSSELKKLNSISTSDYPF